MTEETLLEANRLSNRIKECKDNLKKIRYTQSENVVARDSCFICNGIDDGVTIPKSLFRVIGKLIESEYVQEINKLEEKLNEL